MKEFDTGMSSSGNFRLASRRSLGTGLLVRELMFFAIGAVGLAAFAALNGLNYFDRLLNIDCDVAFADFLENPGLRLAHVTVVVFFIATVSGAVIAFVGIICRLISAIRDFLIPPTPQKAQERLLALEKMFAKVFDILGKMLRSLKRMLENAGVISERKDGLAFDEKLRRLAKLKEEGHVSDAEFEEAKSKILSKIE